MSLHPELDDLKRDGGILSWGSWVRRFGDAMEAWVQANPTPSAIPLYGHDVTFTGWKELPEQFAVVAWWMAFQQGGAAGVAVACVPLDRPQPEPQPVDMGDVMESFGGVSQRALMSHGGPSYLRQSMTRAFDRLVKHLQDEERRTR